MRKKIVAGNWKMNTDPASGVALAIELLKLLEEKPLAEGTGIAIAPPYTHLSEIGKVIPCDKICLTAQNCAAEANGAFTGEISTSMLKTLGVMAVIIGHSERRSLFHEDSPMLAKKVNRAIADNLRPIFCCGEVLEERNAGRHQEIVGNQLKEGLFHLDLRDFERVIIAYEPVWAIGTGVTASPEQAQEMHHLIRGVVRSKYGEKAADMLTILYGGSCKASNARELFAQPDVDGGLIGGASLNAKEFFEIANSF